jgi:hypothetical protein
MNKEMLQKIGQGIEYIVDDEEIVPEYIRDVDDLEVSIAVNRSKINEIKVSNG